MNFKYLLATLALGIGTFPPTSIGANELELRHTKIFSDVVQNYCMKYRLAPEQIDEELKKEGFKASTEFEGTFIKYIDGVDYAVTPDNDFCTTDVLLKPSSSTLFELSQIESTLTHELGLTKTKSSIDYELSSEDKRTKVVKQNYTDEQGNKYSLVFPLENEAEYYMVFDVYWERNNSANK